LAVGDEVPISVWQKIPGNETAKLIVLDFWATFCSNCYANFPEMEELQKEFSPDLQVVLVNSWETEVKVRDKMKQLNKNRKQPIRLPNIPQLNGDKVLGQLFPCDGPPHHVWISSKRRVVAITYHYNSTSKNIQSYLLTGKIELAEKNEATTHFLVKEGLFATHKKLKPLFYSGFIEYDPSLGFLSMNSSSTRDTVAGTFRRTFVASPIIDLYWTAFKNPLDDSTRFFNLLWNRMQYEIPLSGDSIDEWSKDYVVGYEIQVPLKEEKNWKGNMLEDLNRLCRSRYSIEGKFDSVDARCIIISGMPANIRSTGSKTTKEPSEEELNRGIYEYINIPLGSIFHDLRSRIENNRYPQAGKLPIILINGIKQNSGEPVDLKLLGSMSEITNLISQLQQSGFTVHEEVRKISAFVLRDL